MDLSNFSKVSRESRDTFDGDIVLEEWLFRAYDPTCMGTPGPRKDLIKKMCTKLCLFWILKIDVPFHALNGMYKQKNWRLRNSQCSNRIREHVNHTHGPSALEMGRVERGIPISSLCSPQFSMLASNCYKVPKSSSWAIQDHLENATAIWAGW